MPKTFNSGDVFLASDLNAMQNHDHYGTADSAGSAPPMIMHRSLEVAPTRWLAEEASIRTAVTELTAGGGHITIAGAVTLTADLTVPDSITLGFSEIGSLDGAFTLTVEGRIDAPPRQVFGPDLTLAVSNAGQALKLEWFGAVGNGVTDDSDAIDRAFAVQAPIRMEDNKTYLGGNHTGFSGMNISGYRAVWNGAAFVGGSVLKGKISCTDVVGATICDLGIQNDGADQNCIVISGDSSDIQILDVKGKANDHAFLIQSYDGETADILVRRCQSYGGNHGFVSKSKRVRFEDCTAFDAVQDGFTFKSDNLSGAGDHAVCEDNTLLNCAAIGCNVGVYIYGLDNTGEGNPDSVPVPKRIQIIGGRFTESDPSSGINIGHLGDDTGTGKTYLTPEDITITGAYLGGNANRGISVRRVDGFYLAGNTFGGNGVAEAVSVDYNLCSNIHIGKNAWGSDYPGNIAYWEYVDPDATSLDIASGKDRFHLTTKITFTSGSSDPGASYPKLVGATSGATGILVKRVVDSGSWAGGDAVGEFWLINVTGSWQSGEDVNIDGGTSNVATTSAVPSGELITAVLGGRRGQEFIVRTTAKSGMDASYSALGLTGGYFGGEGSVAAFRVNDKGDKCQELWRSVADEYGIIPYESDITVSWSQRKVWKLHATGTVDSITFSEPLHKGELLVFMLRGGGSARTISSWDSRINWQSGVGALGTTTINKRHIFVFMWADGAFWEISRVTDDE